MMNGHRTVFELPLNSNFTIPLLDDEFDPDEEAIFEHSDLAPVHTGQFETEDGFSL